MKIKGVVALIFFILATTICILSDQSYYIANILIKEDLILGYLFKYEFFIDDIKQFYEVSSIYVNYKLITYFIYILYYTLIGILIEYIYIQIRTKIRTKKVGE